VASSDLFNDTILQTLTHNLLLIPFHREVEEEEEDKKKTN